MSMLNEHFLRFFNLYRWAGTHKLLSLDVVMCGFSNVNCESVFSFLQAELFSLQMSANRDRHDSLRESFHQLI